MSKRTDRIPPSFEVHCEEAMRVANGPGLQDKYKSWVETREHNPARRSNRARIALGVIALGVAAATSIGAYNILNNDSEPSGPKDCADSSVAEGGGGISTVNLALSKISSGKDVTDAVRHELGIKVDDTLGKTVLQPGDTIRVCVNLDDGTAEIMKPAAK